MYDKRIDISKGVAAFLVVLTHAFLNRLLLNGYSSDIYYRDWLFSVIGSFFMPLFMLISGYLFAGSIEKRSLGELFSSKFKSIVLPIFVWTYVFNSLRIVVGKFNGDFAYYFYAPMLNMWFLWTVFFNMLTVKVIYDRFNNNIYIHALVTFLLMLLPNWYDLRYFAFMYPVFVFGHYIRTKNKDITNINLSLLLGLFVFLMIFWDIDKYIYVSGSSITSYHDPLVMVLINIYRWVIGITGSLFVIRIIDILFRKFNIQLNVFQNIGKQSMAIYFCDVFIGNQLVKLFPMPDNVNIFQHWIISFLIASLLILIYVVIIRLLNMHKYTKALFLGINTSENKLSIKNTA